MDAAVEALASSLMRLVQQKPQLVLGLPTGQTMVPLYRHLRQLSASNAIDLGGVQGFNLDELLLPREHPASFFRYMLEHAIPGIGLDPRRWRIPDGTARDPEAEAEQYAKELEAAGGLDVAILGLGSDGHIAYNLPGTRPPATHVATLPDSLAQRIGVPQELRPLRAITLGFAELLAARHLLLLATTPEKAQAVRKLVEGRDPVTWPCAALADHSGLELYLTRDAAAMLASDSEPGP